MLSKLYLHKINTPIKQITLASTSNYLLMLEFDNEKRIAHHLNYFKNHFDYELVNSTNHIIKNTTLQLEEYFNQERKKFNIPLKTYGTNFQKKYGKNFKLLIMEKHVHTQNKLKRWAT